MFKDLTATNIKEYYEVNKDTTTANYLGEVLFPPIKQVGLDLSFIKGRNGAPVVLKPSAFDTDVTLRDRLDMKIVETKMPFFKEALLLKEIERQELLRLSQMPNKAYYNAAMNNVFNDRVELIDAADAQVERMRMQLISQGTIAIKANKVDYTYDFGFDKKNNMITLTGEDEWTKETADPLADLEAVIENAINPPELAVMTSRTWGLLKRSPAIAKYLGKEVIVTNKALMDYIKTEFGLDIVLYNKKYKTDVNGAAKNFFPDNVVSLIPKQIGQTNYGTTPEEADLMAGVGTSAEVEIVNTGVAVTTKTNDDPVNVTTKVSEVVLPSGEGMNDVYIINVAEEA